LLATSAAFAMAPAAAGAAILSPRWEGCSNSVQRFQGKRCPVEAVGESSSDMRRDGMIEGEGSSNFTETGQFARIVSTIVVDHTCGHRELNQRVSPARLSQVGGGGAMVMAGREANSSCRPQVL